MRRIKLVDTRKFEIEEVSTPRHGEKEALVRIKKVGICGSDLHIYRGENPVIKAPVVLGHEAVGIVEKTGPKVVSFREGQRVVIIPYVSCGRCEYCRSNHPNVCDNLLTIGGMTENGAFAEYMVLPEDFLINIPEGITLEEAVLIEPTTVAVRAIKRSRNVQGKNIAILGAGTIGLLILQVARIYGAKRILITDIVEEKLKLAKRLGADITLDVSRRDYFKILRKDDGLRKFDVVFDCVVNRESIKLSFSLVKKAHKVVVVGIPAKEVEVNFIPIICGELDLSGSYLYLREDFLEARKLIKDKSINTSSLISKQFPFTEVARAFQEIEENKGKLVKVILNMA